MPTAHLSGVGCEVDRGHPKDWEEISDSSLWARETIVTYSQFTACFL